MSRSVALIGPQGAGKTTIGDLFVEHRHYQRHGIADSIKHVAALAYPDLTKEEVVTLDRYTGRAEVSGREILQEVGAALRAVDVLFWLRVWRRDYFDIVRLGYSVVVDDLRLPSEVAYLRRIDPDLFVVRVFAEVKVREERLQRPLFGCHDITEVAWQEGVVDLEVDTTALTPAEAYSIITEAMEVQDVR